MKKIVSEAAPVRPEQKRHIVDMIQSQVPLMVEKYLETEEGGRLFISHGTEVTNAVCDAVRDIVRRFSAEKPIAEIARWESNYEKLFGKKPDLSKVRIPAKPEGFGPMRLIIVAREIIEWTNDKPLQGTQNALKRHFACWQYVNDLDRDIQVHCLKNGSYAVWVHDVQEADEEFANKSANDLKVESHTGISVLERQLLEADYFFDKGEHLDLENVTLCTDSRDRDGSVPGCNWNIGGFRVLWCVSSARDPHLRSRRAWT